jgi:hypothetical protein
MGLGELQRAWAVADGGCSRCGWNSGEGEALSGQRAGSVWLYRVVGKLRWGSDASKRGLPLQATMAGGGRQGERCRQMCACERVRLHFIGAGW